MIDSSDTEAESDGNDPQGQLNIVTDKNAKIVYGGEGCIILSSEDEDWHANIDTIST